MSAEDDVNRQLRIERFMKGDDPKRYVSGEVRVGGIFSLFATLCLLGLTCYLIWIVLQRFVTEYL